MLTVLENRIRKVNEDLQYLHLLLHDSVRPVHLYQDETALLKATNPDELCSAIKRSDRDRPRTSEISPFFMPYMVTSRGVSQIDTRERCKLEPVFVAINSI